LRRVELVGPLQAHRLADSRSSVTEDGLDDEAVKLGARRPGGRGSRSGDASDRSGNRPQRQEFQV
jgi:hypothetical protein